MLPALRLSFLTLAVLLISTTAAEAKGLSLSVPPEGQVAVAVGSGAKSVKVKSAPAGVTVSGGVKKGRLAVAVVRPRGVAASGKVVFTVGGRVKGLKTFPKALDGGKAPGCADLGALLAKRLKGQADVKALAPVLAAKLCGKTAPAGAAEVLSRLGLGAAATPGPSGPAPAPGGTLTRPGGSPSRPGGSPTPTPTPTAGTKRACDDDVDNDGDGQTDWEDPGCSDAGDTTEDSEIPAPAACAESSGLGMLDDPTEVNVGINPGCGTFWEAEVQIAPGVASCTANNDYECKVYDPIASASLKNGERDGVDMTLTLKGPVDCGKKATIALYRLTGPPIELQEPVQNCKTLPPPAPKCDNGKDDDGDGLVDSRDSAGTTDPDPGCSGVTDTTENSEVPTPESCQVQIGYFGGDTSVTGLLTSGCGVLKGAWFRPPGTPTNCLWAFGDDDWASCGAPKAGTVGVTFPLTNQDLALATKLTAEYQCRNVTVALIREDDSVMSDTVPFCG
jgi:hypothetical protein